MYVIRIGPRRTTVCIIVQDHLSKELNRGPRGVTLTTEYDTSLCRGIIAGTVPTSVNVLSGFTVLFIVCWSSACLASLRRHYIILRARPAIPVLIGLMPLRLMVMARCEVHQKVTKDGQPPTWTKPAVACAAYVGLRHFCAPSM